MPQEVLDETASQILSAASERFLHYGYGKTTMSEIAKDCNMSTGNLYRYFKSKIEIAEMFVHRLRRDHVNSLQEVANDPALRPDEKLRAFFLSKFRLTYERFHDKPKAYELSTQVMRERPSVSTEWENAEGRVLSQVLVEGREQGRFDFKDALSTAKILQDAVHRFTSPGVFYEGEFDELVGELNGVVDLMLDGFSWRVRQKGQAA